MSRGVGAEQCSPCVASTVRKMSASVRCGDEIPCLRVVCAKCFGIL